jgi:hypothetical protein
MSPVRGKAPTYELLMKPYRMLEETGCMTQQHAGERNEEGLPGRARGDCREVNAVSAGFTRITPQMPNDTWEEVASCYKVCRVQKVTNVQG